jgi:plastocyanin
MRLSSAFTRSLLVVAALTACGSSYTTSPSTPTGGGMTGGTNVSIHDFAFSPSTISVKVGTTVTWTNNGPSAHTTTSDGGVWDSGTLGAGGTFQHTFMATGTFGYHCTIHPPSLYPGFVGTVTVTP